MSREIDERVVQMKFESGQFERNVQTSIHSLNELKRNMNFKEATKGFEDFDKAAKGVKLDGLSAAVDAVKVKFGLLDVFVLNVFNRISNAAINTGKQMIKSLSVDQLSAGWGKYEQKTGSVQTIMSATASQFSNTAEQMAVVNAQLDKLNWFTDETSYNFVDMVGNIGKFTSNNIALDTSVTAMQGIANWAAISGANANEASRAMYNLSQSMATGSMRLQDWMSIENANMATAEFKKTALETAASLGTLKKTGENTFSTLDGKAEISAETFAGFRDTLQKGWFSKEVLTETLDRYGRATNKLHEIYETLEGEFTTSSIVEYVDQYLEAVDSAAAESEKLGLSVEETAEKTAEATKDIAETAAEEWGVSVEAAAKMLEQFNNETDRFGLKAFKAAQEAKTFTDAIESVKDAVSTGWMKTYELLFGDYVHAKEFWTNIANTLYDIFAAGGDARNEMLKDWSDMGGREYFIDSIYATLAAILGILAPIKGAWELTFGKMNANLLYDLTVKLRDFMVNLTLTSEQSEKVMRIFRGFFSIIDSGRIIVTRLASGALEVLRRVMGELNIDILEGVANFADLFTRFNIWLKYSTSFDSIFDVIGDSIVFVVRQIKEFIRAIENFGPIRAVIDKFNEAFGGDFSLIEVVVMSVGGAIKFLWDTISNFRIPRSLDDVKNFFGGFLENVRSSLSEIGISFDGIDNIVAKFKSSVSESLDGVNGAFAKMVAFIGGALNGLVSITQDIDWAGVLLGGMGIAMLAILWKMTDAIGGFAEALQNVTGVGKSAKGAFDSIKGYFDALKKNIQVNNLLKTAVAIGALAVAFALLAKLNWTQLATGAGAIVILTGAIAGLTFVFNKLAGASPGRGFTTRIVGLAGSLALIALALNSIKVDETVGSRIITLITVMASLGALSVGMSKLGGSIETGAKTFLAMAASIFVLINVMKSIGKEDVGGIYAGLPVVAALTAVMAGCSKLMTFEKSVTLSDGQTVKRGSSFANVIAMVVGLMLLINVIKSLGKTDPAIIMQGVIMMVPVMGVLVALFAAARLAGAEAKSAGKMILYIALAFNLLAPAINGLAKIPMADLIKGGTVLAALNLLVIAPLIAISGKSGKYAAKAGLMILAIAGAISVLQLAIKTLGRMDTGNLIKGTTAVSVVILSLSTVVSAIASQGEANEDSAKVMTKLMVVIGLISAVIIALTLINPDGALKSSAGIAAVMVSVGYLLDNTKDAKVPPMRDLLKLSGFITIIGGIVAILGAITDWKGALATAGGMSMILLTLASMTQIMKNSATAPTFQKKIETMIPLVKTLGVIMAIFAGISALSGGRGMAEVLYITTAMSELLLAIGGMAQLMKKVTLPKKEQFESLTTFVATIAGIVGIIALALAAVNGNNLDVSNLIPVITGVSMLMLASAGAAKLMDDTKIPDGVGKYAAKMARFIGAIGVILSGLSYLTTIAGVDMTHVLSLATGMSVVIVVFGAAADKMSEAQFDLSLKSAAAMSLLIAAIGGTLALFSTMTDPYTVLPLAIGMSAVLLAVSQAAVILSKFPQGAFKGALEGLGIAAIAIAGMAALMGVIGGLNNMLEGGLATAMEGAVTIFAALGRGIGAFVGGIVGGIGQGIASALPPICASLSQAMQNLVPFFDALHMIPGGALELIGTFIGLVAMITGAQFISGLKAIPGVGVLLGVGSVTLITDFATFGAAIKAFDKSLEGINLDRLAVGAQAAGSLAELANNLPTEGGLMNTILGSKDLDGFGDDLQKLGEAIKKFAVETDGITPATVDAASSAAKVLMGLNDNLPRSGGALQDFLGDKDIAEFGDKLSSFGLSLVSFSISVRGLDVDAIERTVPAAKSLVKLEKSLAITGGAAGAIFGEKNIGNFGTNVAIFGSGLASFSNLVAAVSVQNVQNAVTAGTLLANLEKNLDTTGGLGAWFGGDSSLKQFGANLRSFGLSLQTFSGQLSTVNFVSLNSAVDYIERLVGLEDIDAAANKSMEAVKDILAKIKEVVDSNEDDLKTKGSNIMYWIAQGFENGTNKYAYIAKNAARSLADSIVNTILNKLEIHSPSLVMAGIGGYVVDGLAEGIANNASAEEAAEKKASNIISAFSNELSKLDQIEKTSSLEFQLWQRTEGRGASDAEIAAKQMEMEIANLEKLAKTVGMRKAALDAVEKVSGKDSQAYADAYQQYLQAQIDMYDKQDQLNATQGQVITDERSRMNAYAAYMKENKEVFEMLGKSQEELEAAAMKSAYGMSEEVYAKYKDYEALKEANREAFEALGKTSAELDEYAKQKSGYTGMETVQQAFVDTTKVIEETIDEYSVNIEQSVAKSVSDAVRKGSSGSGGGAGLAVDQAASEGGSSIAEAISKAFDETIGKTFDPTGEQALGGKVAELLDPTGDFRQRIKEAGDAVGIDLSDNVALGILKRFPNVDEAVTYIINNPDEVRGWRELAKVTAEQIGGDFAAGYIKGIKSKLSGVMQAAGEAAKVAAEATAKAQDSNSPSKVAAALGGYFSEGYALGIEQNASSAAAASKSLVDNSVSALDNAKSLIDNVLASDDSFNPVITPVLDMDTLVQQARGIDPILGKSYALNLQTSRIQASEIAQRKNGVVTSQNGTQTPSQNNYNFTQNNYSPKALNRVEIYRQTRNQFSRLKGETRL